MENSSRDGNTKLPHLSPENPVYGSRSNRTGHGTTDWFKIGKGVHQSLEVIQSIVNRMGISTPICGFPGPELLNTILVFF